MPFATPTLTPTPQCSRIDFTTAGGGVQTTMQVYISTATGGATIFYTVANSNPPAPTHTGSTPTGSTLVYSGPISVDWQVYEEFKAIAYKAGMTDSNVTSFVADNRGIQGPQSGSTASSSAIVFSVWDGDWALLEEYGTENTLLESYVQGLHGLVKTVVSNIYYYQDSLESTSHIANASGQLLESYRYDLNGKPQYFDAGVLHFRMEVALACGIFSRVNAGCQSWDCTMIGIVSCHLIYEGNQ